MNKKWYRRATVYLCRLSKEDAQENLAAKVQTRGNAIEEMDSDDESEEDEE
jgi:hypothetical protein